jgi:molybdate transport system ATP-binding protein
MWARSSRPERIRPEDIAPTTEASDADYPCLGAMRGNSSVTSDREIRAEFRSTLGKFTLEAVFKAPATGITMLFGPSGCGKTTVLRCIAGLIHVEDGLCDVAGEIWQDRSGAFVPTHKRALGYVFQEASLFPHLSVRKNLLFGAPDKKHDGPMIDFDEVVDLLGIRALLDRSPRNLSGGERQRVGIGRALLTQPKVLLMDEPLSALDRKTKDEILPFIEKLRDHFALPIFYVTHDMAEVERLGDQMVLMNQGQVVGAGPLEELQSDPSLPLSTRRDAAVSFEGIVQASDEAYGLVTLKVRGGILAAPAPPAQVGERRRIRVIASDVSLTREAPGPSSILNVLPAGIVSMKPLDTSEVVVVVALGEDRSGARLLSRMMRKSWGELGLTEGMSVYAQVKAVALAPGRGELG